MKKIYSIVLMATALLIGANIQAATKVATWSDLRTALQAGGQVELSADINELYDASTFQTIWIGAKGADGKASLTGDAPAAVLDMAGHNITITANSAVAINAFALTKGSLKITGTGTIEITGTTGTTTDHNKNTVATGYPTNSTNVFFVFGADDANKVDPLGQNPFSYLFIDENVTVKTKNGTVIAVDQLTATHAALKKTDVVDKGYATSGMAYGALVEVKGTLISEGADYFHESKDKTTGEYYEDGKKCYGIKTNGNLGLPKTDADKKLAPYVHVYPSAVLRADMRSGLAGAAAAYASGYAQWKIEGTCDGASGVYISAGTININNATISSAAATYEKPGNGGHANGSGSAIVVNSRDRYPGEVELTVSGDTKASATSGYAVQEIVSANDNNTKVDKINIEGGSFEGGAQGALTVSQATATSTTTQVTVAGGNVTGEANIGNDGLAQYLNNQGGTHATIVTDESGKTTLVISEGDAPTGLADFSSDATASVKWTGDSKEISGAFALKELEINEASAQLLTIKKDATLTVERVVLGTKAQIIVEAGAKFIVTGEQGIVAPKASNIVLKNEEGKRSIFLFNPAVSSNKHPNARVELITNSWREDANNLQWEVVGFPTFGTVKNLAVDGSTQVALAILNSNGQFITEGLIGSIDLAKLNKTFAPYDLLANRAKNVAAPKIVIEGELIGNVNADMNAYLRWTPLANSYTGELDMKAFLSALAGAQYVAKGVWVAEQQGNGNLAWQPVDLQAIEDGDEGAITKLAPMQAFMLNNPGQYSEVRALNYASMVWAPATSVPNQGAPARSTTANETTAKARVIVANEQGVVDKVMLRENANNVYALEKYMNEDMNIYVLADEKSAIVNSEDMENTYVGFSTVNGGKFTISFASVTGRELVLVDHETGAQVAIAEGNTYEFTAAANSTNDYRFEIVEPAKLPTSIENTEAVKSAKGIYTITGQYVGEMNVWNTLPAGIYVVNGEKRVK